MQVMDYHEAIFASKLSTHAKLTALIISSYYNWTKKEMCWPSNKTLATGTGLSISSVVRAKKELAREGYILVNRRHDNSNLYRPILPQNIGYIHTEHDPYAVRATNNELNNELNNEVNNGQGSNEPLDINKLRESMSW
jgi:DNA-binding transcriptional MocR family regulator